MKISGFGLFVLLLFWGLNDAKSEVSGKEGESENRQNRIFTSIRLKFQVLREVLFPSTVLMLENGNEDTHKVPMENLSPPPFAEDDFVEIPSKGAGFLMGAQKDEEDIYYNEGGEDGKPVRVRFDYSFAMMKTEVTQMQWFSLTGKNPSLFKKRKYCEIDYRVESTDRGEVQMCPNHPVESVSWNDVQKFIKYLNEREGLDNCDRSPQEAVGCYRLPTEAEWEFAARGGTVTDYSFGNDRNDLKDFGWYFKNSNNQTHGVGLKLANSYGLFDMHGNVWEWAMDKYWDFLPEEDDLLVATESYRIVRGGSWGCGTWPLRSAYRNFEFPEYRYGNIGFRLVKTL